MTTMILVDVEARGVSPVNGQMTEFGAVSLNKEMKVIVDTFHGVLIEAVPDPENPAVPFIADDAKRYSSMEVMKNFTSWLNRIDDRVVFVSDNNGYDFMWIAGEFDRNNLPNPFGHSSRRISDFWSGLNADWGNTQKWKSLRQTKHDHNPVNDSIGNAEALISIIAMMKEKYQVINDKSIN